MLSETCKECNRDSIWQSFSFPLHFSVPFFIGFLAFYNRCPTFPCTSYARHFRVMADPHGSPTTGSWVNVDVMFFLTVRVIAKLP